MMGMKNKIISIGYLGSKKCYLNISREEAIRRYKIYHLICEDDELEDGIDIDEFEIEDEFEAYQIWQ